MPSATGPAGSLEPNDGCASPAGRIGRTEVHPPRDVRDDRLGEPGLLGRHRHALLVPDRVDRVGSRRSCRGRSPGRSRRLRGGLLASPAEAAPELLRLRGVTAESIRPSERARSSPGRVEPRLPGSAGSAPRAVAVNATEPTRTAKGIDDRAGEGRGGGMNSAWIDHLRQHAMRSFLGITAASEFAATPRRASRGGENFSQESPARPPRPIGRWLRGAAGHRPPGVRNKGISGKVSPTATGSRKTSMAGQADVGDTGQGLVLWQCEVPLAILAPDGPMNSPWVACRRREEVDDQQMDAGQQGLDRPSERTLSFGLAALVPRRDDLDHGDDLVAAPVADHDGLGLTRIEVDFGRGVEADLRRRVSDGDPAIGGLGLRPTARPKSRPIQGQHVRPDIARDLLGQRVVPAG